MCWQAVRACIEQSQQRGAAYLVLLIICEHLNEYDGCYPLSVQQIACEARVSRREAHRHVARLAATGELLCERHKGKMTTYRVTFWTPDTIDRGMTPDTIDTPVKTDRTPLSKLTGHSVKTDRGTPVKTDTLTRYVPEGLPEVTRNGHNNHSELKGMERPEAFRAILASLKTTYAQSSWPFWLDGLKLYEVSRSEYALLCDTPMQREQVTRRFHESMRVALQTQLKRSVSLEVMA